MRMTRDLLLCALARAGQPVETGVVLELACDLAVQAGWPSRAVADWTGKMLPPMLRAMAREGQVIANRAAGTWGALTYDADAPIPPPPPPPSSGHVLDELSRDQLIVLHEVQSDMIAEAMSLAAGFAQTTSQFLESLKDVQTRARRRLYSVGLDEGGA